MDVAFVGEVHTRSFQAGICAMMDFLYNTAPQRIIEIVHPGSHESYANEKLDVLLRSPSRWFGMLDDDRRAALLNYVQVHHKKAGLALVQ